MNLRAIRIRAGKSQYELAALANVPQASIHRIEKGEQKPGADIIIKLCDALGCSADELLGRKETKDGKST